MKMHDLIHPIFIFDDFYSFVTVHNSLRRMLFITFSFDEQTHKREENKKRN